MKTKNEKNIYKNMSKKEKYKYDKATEEDKQELMSEFTSIVFCNEVANQESLSINDITKHFSAIEKLKMIDEYKTIFENIKDYLKIIKQKIKNDDAKLEDLHNYCIDNFAIDIILQKKLGN